MKKLLLTSNGLENPKVGEAFVRLLTKPPAETTVLFVPTASRTESEMKYVRKSQDELVAVGVHRENIVWLNANCVVPAGRTFDVVYVCGGNTLYLLKRVRETGFDTKIVELVEAGAVYVGASAGSILAGPDISIAAPFDENDVGITDMRGLGLTDAIVSPHFQNEEEQAVADMEQRLGHPVIRLPDNQALLIEDDKREIIA